MGLGVIEKHGRDERREKLRSLTRRPQESAVDHTEKNTPAHADSGSFRILAATAAIAIVVLGVLDVISTNMVLAAGGRELNPIVAWIMDHLDSWWLLPKVAIHLVAGLLIFYLMASRFTLALAFLLVFIYGLIVHHNFSLALSV